MPGDEWQKFANLRLLYAYMYAHPGKKLLFMGNEFAQRSEWNHDAELEWHLLKDKFHAGIQRLVKDLNETYKRERALHETDFKREGFEWIDFSDWEKSIISFVRKSLDGEEIILVVCNFTPVPRENYKIGVPRLGFWKEILNTDAEVYGGSGWGNFGGVKAKEEPIHNRPYSIEISLPPLGCIYFKYSKEDKLIPE
jgi:1,4-alpha-glucan branching enzyme